MGVTYFKRYRMEINLRDGLFSPPKLPIDYLSACWEESLLDNHADTKFESFRFEIDANVFPCLGNRDGCRRLMNEISGRHNFLPLSTILISHRDPVTDAVDHCGTIQAIRDKLNRGSIQNIGVTPGHRGSGIGSCLIYRACEGFLKEGIDSATLEVTAQNTGALRLYQRLGFRVTRTVYKAVEVAFA